MSWKLWKAVQSWASVEGITESFLPVVVDRAPEPWAEKILGLQVQRTWPSTA